MGWSFFKSFSLGKLLRLNVSGRGLGLGIGPRGANISVGPRGVFANFSPLPGLGLRYRTRLDAPAKDDAALDALAERRAVQMASKAAFKVLEQVRRNAAKVPELRDHPDVAKRIGLRFKVDRGRGKIETMTVTDYRMVNGEPRIFIRFDGFTRSVGYPVASFGEEFTHFEQV